MKQALNRLIFLVPAYNEEHNILLLLQKIKSIWPDVPVCVVDDHSSDTTRRVLKENGCDHLHLACNLGVGGAMQAAFRYALERGYDFAIRLDGDGQHPPEECAKLMERLAVGDVDMVVGSRFLGERTYTSTLFRQAGIWGLAKVLSLVCRRRITDPTSGFQIVNRSVMYYFAHHYPSDYPEPESLAFLSRQGYRCVEVPTAFRARESGTSSIRKWGTLYYMFKVGVALFVDRWREVDRRYDRSNVETLI